MTLTADVLRPHQRRILAGAKRAVDGQRYLVVEGARGVLKTSTMSADLALRMEELSANYSRVSILVVAITHRQLQDVFLTQWIEQAKGLGVEYHYHQTDARIEMANDCNLLLRYAAAGRGGQSAQRASEVVRGMNLTGIYAPEAGTLSQTFWDGVLMAVRVAPLLLPGGTPVPWWIRWLDVNPSAPGHWIHNRFKNPAHPEYMGDHAEVITIPATPATSLWTQAEIDEKRRTMAAHEAARFLDAEWTAAEGAVYDDWDTCDPVRPDDLVGYWIGYDPGTSRQEKGNLAFVLVGQRGDGRWVVADERLIQYRGTESYTEPVTSMVRHWGPAKLRGVVRDWTGLGRVMRDQIDPLLPGHAKVWAPAGDESKYFRVAAGVSMVYEALKSRYLTVSTACPGVMRDLGMYVYDAKGEEPDKKVHDPHLLDALRYLWIRASRQ